MCEPVTIGMAAVALVGGLMAADAQKQEGKFNAAVAENNQRMAVAQADDANRMAARESEQQSWRTRALIGQQRTAIAANNLDATLGTPAEILGETAMFGEVDQQTIRMNAARAAWGFNAQATNYGNQATLSRWSGKAKANATILSSLGQAGSTMAGGMGGGGGSSWGWGGI